MLVKYNRSNIHTAYGARFVNGVNEIKDSTWKQCAQDPEIQRFIKEGVMEPLQGEGKSKGDDGVSTLAGFPEKKAIDIAKATPKLDLLRQWQASEKRPKVKKALLDQAAAVEAKMKEYQEQQGEKKPAAADDEEE